MQSLDVRIEIGVHLDAVAVKFQFGRIEQRFRRGKAGHHVIHRLNEIDDIDHRSVRHRRRDVPRHRRPSR